MKNKGFSLVELIIVMAIMAVLIGVLAPTYLRYVESSQRTADCSNIGAVLDACEVIAADPDTNWGNTVADVIVISIGQSGTEYSGDGPISSLEALASAERFDLDADWGPFEITARKDANGHIIFDIADDSQINEMNEYSEALAGRLE